jgi:hypothetical protein
MKECDGRDGVVPHFSGYPTSAIAPASIFAASFFMSLFGTSVEKAGLRHTKRKWHTGRHILEEYHG